MLGGARRRTVIRKVGRPKRAMKRGGLSVFG